MKEYLQVKMYRYTGHHNLYSEKLFILDLDIVRFVKEYDDFDMWCIEFIPTDEMVEWDNELRDIDKLRRRFVYRFDDTNTEIRIGGISTQSADELKIRLMLDNAIQTR